MAGKGSVGMIGTGLMGTAMTRRLLEAGFTVEGCDPNPEALARFEAAGGRPRASLADLGRSVRRAVISVFNTEQVEDVVAGKAGLLALPAGERRVELLINTSTVGPDRMAALAQGAAAHGLAFMEMPLSGSSGQVAQGVALGLVGDNGGDLARAQDIISAIAPRHVAMGPVGNGAKTKLAINHVLALNRAALAEGLVFAERVGLPLEAFMAAAKQSAAYSQVMEIKGGKMISGDFTPEGRIRQSLKDITLIVAEAEARGQELPLARVYKELMEAGVAAGEGDLDNAGVIKAIRRLRKS